MRAMKHSLTPVRLLRSNSLRIPWVSLLHKSGVSSLVFLGPAERSQPFGFVAGFREECPQPHGVARRDFRQLYPDLVIGQTSDVLVHGPELLQHLSFDFRAAVLPKASSHHGGHYSRLPTFIDPVGRHGLEDHPHKAGGLAGMCGVDTGDLRSDTSPLFS